MMPKTTEAPVATEVPEETEPEQLYVVQVVTDLIPGEIITEDMLQMAAISHETYSLITLGGTGLYQWRSHDAILGCYSTTFIPSGQYLAYDHIAGIYSEPVNPWMINEPGDGMVFLTIPLQNTFAGDGMNYGTVFDVAIEKQTTKVLPNAGEEETPEEIT